MSWDEVPAKLAQYAQETYSPPYAVAALFNEFGVYSTVLAEVPVGKRVDFEAALDYRLGACINLRKSRAISPRDFKKDF